MKVKIMTAAAIPLMMAGFANADGTAKAHGGVSVGGQLGYITQDSKITHKFLGGLQLHKRKDTSGDGVVGGINLAYGHLCPNHIFLGAEFKWDFTNLSGKTNEGNLTSSPQISHRLKMTNGGGLALKVGGVVCHALPYFKVGFLSSEWKLSTNILLAGFSSSSHKKKRSTGLELGMGIDLPLTEKFAMGCEFTHVEYQKLSKTHIIDTTEYVKVSAKPRTNAFMLRAKFRVY